MTRLPPSRFGLVKFAPLWNNARRPSTTDGRDSCRTASHFADGLAASRNFVLPKSERERLAAAYTAAPDEPDRYPCDLLILNRPDVEAYGFRPDPQRFALTYRNDSFELWLRRTDDSSIARARR